MSDNESVDMTEAEFQEAIRAAKAEAWAEGCKKGLRTNPGWDEEALASNPYGTAK